MLTELHLHTGQPVAPHDVWTAWEIDPLVLGAVAVTALAYGRGLKSLSRRDTRGRFFGAGVVVVLVAVASPLEGMAGSLASAHMVQHMLLVMVAAPLLAWARPLPTILHGSPLSWRKATGSWRRRWRLTPSRMDRLAHPALAWLFLAGTLWLWHSSSMYDLALRSEAVHALEHALFLVAAVWFWSAVLRGMWSPRHSVGPAILMLFTMGVQGVLLSAMLTFSDYPWYEAYAGTAPLWGLTPLEDQHLAGLIMWIPGGLLYTGSALAVLIRWLGETGGSVEAELESRPTDI